MVAAAIVAGGWFERDGQPAPIVHLPEPLSIHELT